MAIIYTAAFGELRLQFCRSVCVCVCVCVGGGSECVRVCF